VRTCSITKGHWEARGRVSADTAARMQETLVDALPHFGVDSDELVGHDGMSPSSSSVLITAGSFNRSCFALSH